MPPHISAAGQNKKSYLSDRETGRLDPYRKLGLCVGYSDGQLVATGGLCVQEQQGELVVTGRDRDQLYISWKNGQVLHELQMFFDIQRQIFQLWRKQEKDWKDVWNQILQKRDILGLPRCSLQSMFKWQQMSTDDQLAGDKRAQRILFVVDTTRDHIGKMYYPGEQYPITINL